MWFIYSVLTGFFLATSGCVAKIAMQKNSEYSVGLMRLVFACPFLLLILFWVPIPKLDSTFYLIILILLPLEALAYILALKAVKLSPLSLIMPFLAISPVLAIITSWLFLGEILSGLGIFGIFLVAIGGYVLNINTLHLGLSAPIKAIVKEKGSRYMLAAASIFSITAVLGKQAIMHSSVMFFSAVYFPAVALVLAVFIKIKQKNIFFKINSFKSNIPIFLTLGITFVPAIAFHNLAVVIADVAYMMAVKRISMFFGILYGAVVFKETNIKERLLGACIMFLGLLLISFA